MEGGSNLGDGKNSGNNISGSDMPTNNVDLVDQQCRDISGWTVTQRSGFDYMYHCTSEACTPSSEACTPTIEACTPTIEACTPTIETCEVKHVLSYFCTSTSEYTSMKVLKYSSTHIDRLM